MSPGISRQKTETILARTPFPHPLTLTQTIKKEQNQEQLKVVTSMSINNKIVFNITIF